MRNHRYIYYLIGSTIILVIINTVFYLMQAAQNEKKYNQTLQTSQIIETAATLLIAIKDQETGQRGYLLTNNIGYLTPYIEARKKTDRILNRLLRLTAGNTAQNKNVTALKRYINIKSTELAQTLKLNNEGRRDLALKLTNTNRGKTAMENIERLISDITSIEKRTLLAHNHSFNRLNRRIQIFTIAGSYMLLVVIVVSLITIIQNREQIVKLFRQVDDKNKQLEFQKNELQKLSQGLIKQNSELERFAYVASHDLRSPAVNVTALLQLYESSVDAREREELIEAIKQVAENLMLKLDDLIEMLKSKDTTIAEYESINFEKVFTKILNSISAEIKTTGAIIDYNFSAAPNIRYPRSYMESIIQNLLTNAIKYRHPDRPPYIRIHSFTDGKKTCMEIQDNGIGIDMKKDGHRLFGIYQTLSDRKDSRGIGLYITKAQIVAMGGSIEANSIPGEGTTFKICFN